MEPLQPAVWQVDLVHTAAAQGQNGVDLLHHVDVVQAIQAVPAPAHILKRAGHIFLAVQVIGLVAVFFQLFVGIFHHFCHFCLAGQLHLFLEKVSTLFQSQGVDGDVGGIEPNDLVQAPAEAFIGILGKSGDQIHIDGLESGIHRFLVGPQHILGVVGSAAGFQYGIHHGLGVDAHTVGAVLPDRPQFFCV